MSTPSKLVPAFGTTPNNIYLLGEAPGEDEARARYPKPFIGAAGQHMDELLSPYNLSSRLWRRNNVVQQYTPGNPDPTPAQIAQYSAIVEADIVQCQPKLIIAAGKFAAEWLLGKGRRMRAMHGVVHEAGCFDSSVIHRACGADVLPIYHPARGLHVFKFRAHNQWDFEQVAKCVKAIKSGNSSRSLVYPKHIRQGYHDVSGYDLAEGIAMYVQRGAIPSAIGLDCEGSPTNPWSIQLSYAPGHGLVLMASDSSFAYGIDAIQELVNCGCLFITHMASSPVGAGIDITLARAMGLDLSHANIFDTMYAAYLLGTEPWGLDDLAWRHLGIDKKSYKETMSGYAEQRQIDYLQRIKDLALPRADPVNIRLNNGMMKPYRPTTPSARAHAIIRDWKKYKDSNGEEGKPVDIMARWAIDKGKDYEGTELVHNARMEAEFLAGGKPVIVRVGKHDAMTALPEVSFNDLPLDKAIYYAAGDADVTLRLYPILHQRLVDYGVDHLMRPGVDVIKILEDYQQKGFPASRSYFVYLSARFLGEMHSIQDDFMGAMNEEPFNPNSPDDTAKLVTSLGIPLTKKTPTGKLKTGKDVLEQYRYQDDSLTPRENYAREMVDRLFGYRARSKRRGTYCQPVIDTIPSDKDIYPVHFPLGITTATRRLAGPLLTIPVRQSSGEEAGFGKLIRQGYMTPPGYSFYSCDFSGWEMRVFAHITKDPVLMDYFIKDRDPHAELAKRLFGVEIEDQDAAQHRIPAKTVNFAVIYGAYGAALLVQFKQNGLKGWTVEACNDLVDNYYIIHTGAANYKEALLEIVRYNNGIVLDHWGMPRRLPGVFSNDDYIVLESQRKAVSHVCQGTAQGALHNSMIWLAVLIDEMNEVYGYDIRPCLQLHDELMFWFKEEVRELGDARELLEGLVFEAMMNHNGLDLSVPVKVDGHFGKTWGELK